MSDGPTTAGSIVGKLKLDKAQWDADVAAAKADARELGALSPTIRVDANVGDAVTKLEAVRAAETGVDDGNKNMGQSAGGAASRMALVAGAVAALIPLLPALAGYMVGVSGALAGMGAAGILAIFGVKNAMDEGTSAGNQFAAGIEQLKTGFNQLANTAAAGLLDSFNQSVGMLNDALPSLNSQISKFAQQLGTVGTLLLSGVLNAFKVLNPLFVQAGAYVEQLAVGFQKWTANGGLQKFTTMAVAMFPQVAQALGAIATAVLNVVQAMAPLGSVMLTTLTVIGNVVSFLTSALGPAFAPIVAGALAAVGAFKLMGVVEPIIVRITAALGGLAAAEDLALGPIGWVVAAATALGAAFLVAASSTDAAATAQADFTAAVQQDNGIVGQAVRQQAAKLLGDEKALVAAQNLGIATKTLTNATTGQVDAQKKLESQIAALKSKQSEWQTNVESGTKTIAAGSAAQRKAAQDLETLTNSYEGIKKKIKDTISAYNDVANSQGLATISSRAQLQAQTELAARYGMTLPAFLAAQGAQKQNADQADATTHALQLENDAASLLVNAFNKLNGTNLGVAQAQTAAAAATNTLMDSLTNNTTAIDGNSKGAVANQQALEGKVAADQAAAEAIAKQTGSTEAGTKAFAASRQALIDQLTASHQLTPAIQALIDKYYAVPPVVKTKAEMDADAAVAKAAELKAKLDHIQRVIDIQVNMHTNSLATAGVTSLGSRGSQAQADGGTIHAAAGMTVPGAMYPYGDSVHAMLAPSEEVISNRFGQASAYRPLLKAVNAGASPAQVASIANRYAGTSTAQPVNVRVTLASKGGIDLTKYIEATAEIVSNRWGNRAAQQLQGGSMY